MFGSLMDRNYSAMAEGMRVRVRAATGGPTHKLTIPPPCRLQDLYDRLAALTSIPSSSLSISLNKRNPIQAHNHHATLSSLGITPGDLIFYFTAIDSGSLPFAAGIRSSSDAALGFSLQSADVAKGIERVEGKREEGLVEGREGVKEASLRRKLCGSAAMQRMNASLGFCGESLQPDAGGKGNRAAVDNPSSSVDVSSFSGRGGGRSKEFGLNKDTEEISMPGFQGKHSSKADLNEVCEETSMQGFHVANLSECGSRTSGLGYQGKDSNPGTSGASPRIAENDGTNACSRQGEDNCDIDLHESGQDSPMVEFSTEDHAAGAENLPNYQISIPDLLHRVLVKQVDKVSLREGVLVLALHAVMLETGFVSLRSSEETGSCNPYALPSGWNRKTGSISLEYTLPDLLISSRTASPQTAEIGKVLLKCHMVGGSLVVYGTVLGAARPEIQRLTLSIQKYLQESPGDSVEVSASSARPLQEYSARPNDMVNLVGNFSNIFEFWKEVKDKLSLWLLTALCEISNMTPPPSFLLLPTELKMRVLEMLPGLDLAKMGCVCSELRFLSSSEDLWKGKCVQEFGLKEGELGSEYGWKMVFAREWVRRKQRNEVLRDHRLRFRPDAFPFRMRRPPYMGPGIRIIGGDYDIFPSLPRGFRDGTNQGGFRGTWGHNAFPRESGGNDNASFESFC